MWSVTTLLEIFLPCFFGDRILSASSKLTSTIFATEWPKRLSNKSYATDLKIFMGKTNQQRFAVSFAWITLNLETFTSILNFGYSLFSFMKNFI